MQGFENFIITGIAAIDEIVLIRAIFQLTFLRISVKNEWRFIMRHILKSIFTVIVTSSAFFLGFYLGKEKIMSMIPNFQEDLDEKP